MASKQVLDASGLSGMAEISIEKTRKRMQTNCALFVDENVVSLGVAASNEESSTSKVCSSLCKLRKPASDQCSCIYKRSGMAPSIVCLRYLIVASFIVLAIFGSIECGIGSYFVHQLHGPFTKPEWYGPPVFLLVTGILNVILGPYFWFAFDGKYNRPQLFLFLFLVTLVAILQACASTWAIIAHGEVDSSILRILEKKFTSVGRIDHRSTWNITEIKLKCCDFEDLLTPNRMTDEANGKSVISWSCCNSRSYNDKQSENEADTCEVFYINECRDLALHRYRSVLIKTFIVALCATISQILEWLGLWSYTNTLLHKRRGQSFVTSVNRPHSRVTCPAQQLGAQHVCEGCSSIQYHE